jgi:Ca-activated chloride channel family protein
LRLLILYLVSFLSANTAAAQYYLRGEIKDDKNQGLQGVKIFLHSAKANYYSGNQGSFGITAAKKYDTLTLSLEGYESKTIAVKTDLWQTLSLKVSPFKVNKTKSKLISFTKNQKHSGNFSWFAGEETYFQLIENEFVNTLRYSNTGFSLNINKASYSNIRRFLNMNSAVPPDAVRIEELINYFNLHYKPVETNEIFHVESQLTDCPWNIKDRLLFLNISAKKLDLGKTPASNFVFLIDVSGSMDMPNRLPLLQAAFQLFVKNLRSIDTISIVTYGGSVGVWLQPTSGSEKDKICRAIEELTASGDTPGESAIRMAYNVAKRNFIKGGNNRVILATDGDFNVGETTEKGLEELIASQKQTGVYLTCLGVGMGNLKDSKLQTLAKKGNGNYAYIDDIKEAEKTLVQELSHTMYAVADNASLNITFEPSVFSQYRLIGFDNDKAAIKDSTSGFEGGEIGSGNSTIAIFQVTPSEDHQLPNRNARIADVTLHFRQFNDSTPRFKKYVVPDNYQSIDSISKELKFATAVTLFALKLRQSKFINEANWALTSSLAAGSADKTNYLQNEFLQLIEKAKKIYPDPKKKNKMKIKLK